MRVKHCSSSSPTTSLWHSLIAVCILQSTDATLVQLPGHIFLARGHIIGEVPKQPQDTWLNEAINRFHPHTGSGHAEQ